MGIAGHHVPVWYDEATGPANGQGVFWNAATQRWEPADVDTSALDTAGLATDAELAAGLATKQPVDSDLTAIAALSTTAYGRSFLALADAAAGRTALALGTAATQSTGAFDAAGAAAAAQAASQPLDSDLTAIAALSTTSFGLGLLALADGAALAGSIPSGTYAKPLTALTVTADVTAVAAQLLRIAPVSRTVTDGVITPGSSTVTSATLALTEADTGSYVVAPGIQALATATYVNATTLTVTGTGATGGTTGPSTGRSITLVKPLAVTLPTGAAGDVVVVSKTNGLISTITVNPSGGTINGASTLAVSAPLAVCVLTCTAANTWVASGDYDGRQIGPATFRSFPNMRAYDSHTSPTSNTDTQLVAKAPGSGDVAPWEAWHQDVQGDIVHFNCGAGMVGSADAASLFGLGCDYEGTGIYLHVRSTGGGGKGLRIGIDNGVTWANAVGIEVSLGSGSATGAKFIQSPQTTASGPAVNFWAQIAIDSTQKLCIWQKPNTNSVGTTVGFVRAIDGYLFWNAPFNVTSDVVGAVPLAVVGIAGQTADLAQFSVSGVGQVASITKDGIAQMSFLRAQASSAYIELYDTGGTANVRRYRWANSSGALSLTARNDAASNLRELFRIDHATGNISILDAASVILGTTTGTKLGTATTQKLGFWNATPVVQQARPTDAASIITLLTTLGLCA